VPRREYLFTSESVSEGHPDKVCDRISDAVVDTYLKADPYSRVACETLTTTNRVVLAGETRGPTVARSLEPPGFLGLHYGPRTPISLLFSHLVYGAILGAFYPL